MSPARRRHAQAEANPAPAEPLPGDRAVHPRRPAPRRRAKPGAAARSGVHAGRQLTPPTRHAHTHADVLPTHAMTWHASRGSGIERSEQVVQQQKEVRRRRDCELMARRSAA